MKLDPLDPSDSLLHIPTSPSLGHSFRVFGTMGETRNSSLVHRVPDGAIADLLLLELKGVNVLGLAWMYRFVGRVIAMFLFVVWFSTVLAVGLTHACACSQRCDKKVVSNVKSNNLSWKKRAV
jgi:hypothetical protein